MHEVFGKFLENIRLSTKRVLSHKAYRIDGNDPSMRESAGLGTLRCCDYLLDDCKTIVEDTQLAGTVRALQKEYSALVDDDAREGFVRERVLLENCLKVYGTMLILCRLDQWPDKCAFWLVITGKSEEKKFVAGFGRRLEREIRTALESPSGGPPPLDGTLRGAQLANGGVRIMPEDEFEKRLELMNNN